MNLHGEMKMRDIRISTDTFAAIWSLRAPGENDEEAILSRILAHFKPTNPTLATFAEGLAEEHAQMGKIRWVDDVVAALKKLGGTADLGEIYRVTRRIRNEGARSQPPSLEATIRRTIEDHSSDSANFRGKNLFKLVGRGRWALR